MNESMKYEVLLLNYHSKWVSYCDPTTAWEAEQIADDLKFHNFQPHQIKIQPIL